MYVELVFRISLRFRHERRYAVLFCSLINKFFTCEAFFIFALSVSDKSFGMQAR